MIGRTTCPDEVTPLIAFLPSASSTEMPTQAFSKGTDGYRSVAVSDDQILHEGVARSNKALTFLKLAGASVLVGLLAIGFRYTQVIGEELPVVTPDDGSAVQVPNNIEVPSNIELPLTSHFHDPIPFSTSDPVADLGMLTLVRSDDTSPPDTIYRKSNEAIPTNQWYTNLLQLRAGEPTAVHRTYVIPDVVDVVGPIPGLRINPSRLGPSVTVVQLLTSEGLGLTLGASGRLGGSRKQIEHLTNRYMVQQTTPLGITLQWDALPMSSSIVRGMPYVTMLYPPIAHDNELLPTLYATINLREDPIADEHQSLKCSTDGEHETIVKRELKLVFRESDFTWLIFFSIPVKVRCITNPNNSPGGVALQFHAAVEGPPEDIIVRMALASTCTTGSNSAFCQFSTETKKQTEAYMKMLRDHADTYPGPDSKVSYEVDNKANTASLVFDWDVKSMAGDESPKSQLISYALPHQLGELEYEEDVCKHTMRGRSCIVKGSLWNMNVELPPNEFHGARSPKAAAMGPLSNALQQDMMYQIPEYYMRGAGDTYFSGKMLARAARILVIAEEVESLCGESGSMLQEAKESVDEAYCANVTVPTSESMESLLDMLRKGVQVWADGTAETPFVYDERWGGVVSCGCWFNSDTSACDNQFPDCPTFVDPGINFGNGFYNDHHFHYGYFIYAAAVVAKFDPAWGRQYFEEVNLLIRDIANPSRKDPRFPLARHKDWYEGHSWASGISDPAYLNGKNQESSSEAIASYEAISLYGKAMTSAWEDNEEGKRVAKEIQNVGRILTALEIQSTDKYWHVRLKIEDEKQRIYPKEYRQNAIGILFQTMGQFQTWFGSAPYLACGIQLLPITPISEYRDDVNWLKELYIPFSNSCHQDEICAEQGWSILLLSLMASVGHSDLALEKAQALDSDVFDTAGGNGHSLSNTIWYIATRLETDPVKLPKSDLVSKNSTKRDEVGGGHNCFYLDTCTKKVLDTDASGFTCRERINWLIHSADNTPHDACVQVAAIEFPDICGQCDPDACTDCVFANETKPEEVEESEQCPPCSEEKCVSDLNRCPIYDRTFVCTKGSNAGGCQGTSWDLFDEICTECCELTNCPATAATTEKKVVDHAECGPCDHDVCHSTLNLCPLDQAPYLCIEGVALGGCSPIPWDVSGVDCNVCCYVAKECMQ